MPYASGTPAVNTYLLLIIRVAFSREGFLSVINFTFCKPMKSPPAPPPSFPIYESPPQNLQGIQANCLMSVIPVTRKAGIWEMAIQGQPGQKVRKTS
jgi:hypothetical protein